MWRDALKKISSLGYDLTDGLNITDEEKQALNNILNDNAENNKEYRQWQQKLTTLLNFH